MRRTARYRPEFLRALHGRRFRHPETGNRVLFQSLPAAEQQRIYGQWSARNTGGRVRETPSQEDVERRVSDFLGGMRGDLPDHPLAAMQYLMLNGVVSKADSPHQGRIREMIDERLDEQERRDEAAERARPWWKRMMDVDASARVAARWRRGLVAAGPRIPHRAPKYKKLVVFDFDGTLFRSPHPPDDHGEEDEWWTDERSLGEPHVPDKPGPEMWHPESVERLREAVEDPDAYVVVMTGRNVQLHDRVEQLLRDADLRPDELITNPEVGNTTGFKRDEMRYLLRQMPNVREVEFWEDKKADLKGYRRLAEKLGMRFVPMLVQNYEDEEPPYVGVFLTPKARRKLLEDFPPQHENVKADHVTLVFRPTAEQFERMQREFGMGRRVPLRVTGVAQDDKAQAVEVELPEGIAELGTRRPHVTVSVAEGVEPVYSNEMLAKGSRPVAPRVYEGYLDAGPRHAEEHPSKSRPRREPADTEKRRIWQEFLQTKTRNPEYGRPGHHKERILRKTLYDAGPAGRRQVMREWGPYLQQRRSR